MSELEIDYSQPEDSVLRGVTNAWSKIVVPFYRESHLSNVHAKVLGSGFFGSRNNQIFLITALHVIEDIAKEPTRGMIIGDTFFWLRNCYFARDPENDLALTDVGQIWNGNRGKEARIQTVNLDEKAAMVSADAFSLIGYPASQNELLPKFNRVHRKIYSCALNESKCTTSLPASRIKDKARFEFDRRKITDGHNRHYTAPELGGMSGSPILEIHPKPSGFDITLKAVFAEEHTKTKELVGVARPAVTTLMDRWAEHYATRQAQQRTV